MRIAIAGDWHASSTAAWANAAAAADWNADLIFHVGDFFYTGQWGHNFLNSLDKAMRRVSKKTVFIRGNHDDTNALRRFEARAHAEGTVTPEGFIPLRETVFWAPDGLSWTWAGTDFTALGGAPSIDRAHRTENVSWWADEETSEEAVAKAIARGHTDVLMMHDVPLAVMIRNLGPNGNSANPNFGYENRERLQRVVNATNPAWMFSGHYHSFQTEEVPSFSGGRAALSVILDRGDYIGEENSPFRPSRSMFVADVADGKLTVAWD